MKKWILTLILIVVILLFALPYIFIPSTLKITSIVKTSINSNGAFRSLSKKTDWVKWWPGGHGENMPFCTDFIECRFNFNGFTYAITGKYYNALVVTISKENHDYESQIVLNSLNGDSTYVHWTYSMPTSMNPFARISNYQEALRQKVNMDSLLLHLRNFLDKPANVYGQDIRLIMSTDSTLVVINLKTPSIPNTGEIYRSIASLRAYTAASGAKENNFPMLLPNKNNPGAYETFVALSINKALPGKGNIVPRRYVPWKDLMVEVKGGDSAISRARAELNNYILDNQIQVMSKTFESLVTDRNIEKDSSKWITRLICSIP